MNSALKTLMSNDSKLTTLHIGKMANDESMHASTDDDSSDGGSTAIKKQNNTLKIGEIKI